MHWRVTLRCVPKLHVGRDEAGEVHIVCGRLQPGILPWHTSAQRQGVLTHILITVSLSSTIPASEHKFRELKTASWAPDHELSAVFYYLQLKLAMNKEIKINKLLLQPACRAGGKKKNLNQVYLLKWTWLHTLCVNLVSPSYVLLQDKAVLRVKPEGANKSFQYFQFTWQSSVHGKTECSEGSSIQDIYITKYHLAAVSYV